LVYSKVDEKCEIKKSHLLNGRVGLLNGGKKWEARSWKLGDGRPKLVL